MHKHGPDPLTGPLRGTSVWWHGRRKDESSTNTTALETPPVTPAKRTRKPRKIRTELVERVRKEIAAGTYDTQEKFHAALERLVERLIEG